MIATGCYVLSASPYLLPYTFSLYRSSLLLSPPLSSTPIFCSSPSPFSFPSSLLILSSIFATSAYVLSTSPSVLPSTLPLYRSSLLHFPLLFSTPIFSSSPSPFSFFPALATPHPPRSIVTPLSPLYRSSHLPYPLFSSFLTSLSTSPITFSQPPPPDIWPPTLE